MIDLYEIHLGSDFDATAGLVLHARTSSPGIRSTHRSLQCHSALKTNSEVYLLVHGFCRFLVQGPGLAEICVEGGRDYENFDLIREQGQGWEFR